MEVAVPVVVVVLVVVVVVVVVVFWSVVDGVPTSMFRTMVMMIPVMGFEIKGCKLLEAKIRTLCYYLKEYL